MCLIQKVQRPRHVGMPVACAAAFMQREALCTFQAHSRFALHSLNSCTCKERACLTMFTQGAAVLHGALSHLEDHRSVPALEDLPPSAAAGKPHPPSSCNMLVTALLVRPTPSWSPLPPRPAVPLPAVANMLKAPLLARRLRVALALPVKELALNLLRGGARSWQLG